MSNAWRAIAIFGPTRMLPLMSTRIARLTAEVWSDRIDRIGRGSPLSRTSKSAVVSPLTGRPRRSLTDAWMLTRSTELRKVACGLCPGACAMSEAPVSVVAAAAESTMRWTHAFIDVPPGAAGTRAPRNGFFRSERPAAARKTASGVVVGRREYSTVQLTLSAFSLSSQFRPRRANQSGETES